MVKPWRQEASALLCLDSLLLRQGVRCTILAQRFRENLRREQHMTAAEREILRLERQQVSAFNGRNLDALLEQFAPGFVGFSSTRFARIAGRPALRKTFEHYLDQSPRLRYRITQPRVQVCDGTAVATFYWTVQLSPRQKIQGRGSHVFVKQRGRWSIVHEHFSRSH
jgi:ketosteroid isomerase-like protein